MAYTLFTAANDRACGQGHREAGSQVPASNRYSFGQGSYSHPVLKPCGGRVILGVRSGGTQLRSQDLRLRQGDSKFSLL